jgi:hypothetical protein
VDGGWVGSGLQCNGWVENGWWVRREWVKCGGWRVNGWMKCGGWVEGELWWWWVEIVWLSECDGEIVWVGG